MTTSEIITSIDDLIGMNVRSWAKLLDMAGEGLVCRSVQTGALFVPTQGNSF